MFRLTINHNCVRGENFDDFFRRVIGMLMVNKVLDSTIVGKSFMMLVRGGGSFSLSVNLGREYL